MGVIIAVPQSLVSLDADAERSVILEAQKPASMCDTRGGPQLHDTQAFMSRCLQKLWPAVCTKANWPSSHVASWLVCHKAPRERILFQVQTISFEDGGTVKRAVAHSHLCMFQYLQLIMICSEPLAGRDGLCADSVSTLLDASALHTRVRPARTARNDSCLLIKTIGAHLVGL